MKKSNDNWIYWSGAVIMEFGAWLIHHGPAFLWVDLWTPFNVGSLLVALGGVLIAGKGVRTERNANRINSRQIH